MPTVFHARALLLDMDGTLVDSTPVVERLWTEWAAGHGLDPARVLAVIHGRQGHESMALLLPARPRADNIAEGRQMLRREAQEVRGVVAVPGAGALMRAVARLPHAVVTSAPEALMRARMRAAGLRIPSVAVTAEDVTVGKPDPQGFLRAAALLHVAAAECVVLEDSVAGIAAGRAAGMPVIAVGAAVRDGAAAQVPDLTAMRVAAVGADLTISVA